MITLLWVGSPNSGGSTLGSDLPMFGQGGVRLFDAMTALIYGDLGGSAYQQAMAVLALNPPHF